MLDINHNFPNFTVSTKPSNLNSRVRPYRRHHNDKTVTDLILKTTLNPSLHVKHNSHMTRTLEVGLLPSKYR